MSTTTLRAPRPHSGTPAWTVVLVGNPNSGKTSLFNRLTGLSGRTANHPGTTVEFRRGTLRHERRAAAVTIVDSPGIYGLEASSPEEAVTAQLLAGEISEFPQEPAVIVHVMDATNVQRGLALAFQVLGLGRPTLVVLTMMDAARKRGLQIDVAALEHELNCRVIAVSSRTGENIDAVTSAITDAVTADTRLPLLQATANSSCTSCARCPYAARFDHAESVARRIVDSLPPTDGPTLSRIDRIVTGPIAGLFVFAAVMFLMFMLVFWLADYPMSWLDALTVTASDIVRRWLPAGLWSSLLADGVIAGVGGVLVFIPQIFLLFVTITILEETGYLARAACVMDRWMQCVGLPGKAFVPMVAAHACAIPAVMASRVINDRRDRLRTILIIPLLTCSARVPVFSMVVALLFPSSPVLAAGVFAGAYALAVVGAITVGWLFKQTLLPGAVRPLLIELPEYRMPSIRNALLVGWDRAAAFVGNAGSVILLFSVFLWFLAYFPRASTDQLVDKWRADHSTVGAEDPAAQARWVASQQLEQSFAGRLGKAVQPVFAPLGFDWRLSVGVLNSFAAREVVVSTLAILYDSPDQDVGLLSSLRSATDADGNPTFTTPTCLSLLVFFVFAMQCFPTLAVIRRELGGWKWPLFQLGYMSSLAYLAALLTFHVSRWLI